MPPLGRWTVDSLPVSSFSWAPAAIPRDAPVVQSHERSRAGVAYRRVAGKRPRNIHRASLPFEAHSIRVEFHQQGGLVGRRVVTKRPGDNRTTNVRARGIAQVLRHEHPAAPFEQGAFFFREMRRILEVAQVGFPQVGQHAFGGMDALCEPRHFARLADASFDERQVVVVVQGPNAQGDPELAVVAHGASMHPHRLRQESHDPFFHGGFAVAPSDGKHGAVEAARPRPCHALREAIRRFDKDVELGAQGAFA